MLLARERDERRAVLWTHAGGIHDSEARGREALARDVMQHVERGSCRRLVVLVIRDETSAVVGRQDLRRPEVLPRERGLAAARRSDEHDQRELWDPQRRHRVNTAIWVGAPTAGSSSPIDANRTWYPLRSATPRAHACSSPRVHSNR